jgi:sugar lactone lactonase YvrE
VYASRFRYCNGVGIDQQERVLVVENRGLMYVDPAGSRTWLIEQLPSGGEGFAFDIDGNVYVAGGRNVTVVSPEGRVIEELAVPPGPAMVTNCCFGGPDLRTLYATDGGSGRVVAFTGMPVSGVELVSYAV